VGKSSVAGTTEEFGWRAAVVAAEGAGLEALGGVVGTARLAVASTSRQHHAISRPGLKTSAAHKEPVITLGHGGGGGHGLANVHGGGGLLILRNSGAGGGRGEGGAGRGGGQGLGGGHGEQPGPAGWQLDGDGGRGGGQAGQAGGDADWSQGCWAGMGGKGPVLPALSTSVPSVVRRDAERKSSPTSENPTLRLPWLPTPTLSLP
jgi:hypothetical protein